ncbi:MAG: heterodisulfide reductase-related iron-sulfur binding cluster, partial [Sporomusa sp.]
MPEVKLSYHDPCHLVRGQGIKAEPRKLLKQAGVFVESLKADMCCGGAGSFHMDFPEQSKKILVDKHNCFKKSGADIIVTECPACMIQLKKACDGQAGYKVMHISQVM